ncbi:MAG: hypothetical protein LBS88_10110 [Tannerellaceae bacterium]|jgi:hypothetical protein|nr:hypothetical protein [Tannerellaceae bacterium]
MNEKKQEDDWLKSLFSRMPEEELPASFGEKMMKRIEAETVRLRKRNERIGLALVILASSGLIGLATATLLYIGLPRIEWELPELSTLPFYLYIGTLSLLLLGIDHILVRLYGKKNE